MGERRLVALTRGHRMKCLLRRMLDPEEFLSDYGVRSVSKYHKEHPYALTVRGEQKVVNYEPAECPTGSGRLMHLSEVANELSNRLIKIWLRDEKGECAFARSSAGALNSPQDRHRYLFHEYFHADTGAGLGASHQTGWTGLVAKLIQQQGEFGTITK